MKEIIKASVAGYSFTFEKEAHHFLENYLNEIEMHFSSKEDGTEIVEGIEERMSELLRIDIGATDRVVTLSDVEHLVNIMGKPSDMDDEEPSINASSKEGSGSRTSTIKEYLTQKRIFRDKDSAILGGVLSGLSNYFQVEVVLLRIGFVLAFILGSKYVHEIGSVLLLGYIICWIVIPKAKTIGDKLAMSGKNPSISDIETGNKQPLIKQTSKRGKTAANILKVILFVLLIVTGVSLLVSLIFGIFFPTLLNVPSLPDFFQIIDFHSTETIWLIALIVLMPILAIIYVAIRLIKGLKAKDAGVLGIGFVVWVALCSYLGVLGVKYARNYKQYATEEKALAVNTPSDTVYVRLGDEYKDACDLTWSNSDGNVKQIDADTKAWFIVPRIQVEEDTTLTTVQIKIDKKAYAANLSTAEEKVKNSVFEVEQRDSLVLLKPHIYSLKNHWDREKFDITIVYPKGKTVVLDNLLKNVEDWDFDFDVD